MADQPEAAGAAAEPLKSDEKRPGDRDGLGRFRPGHSLHGPGRPRGIDLKALADRRAAEAGSTLEERVWKVVEQMLTQAAAGDVQAARLVMDRLAIDDSKASPFTLTLESLLAESRGGDDLRGVAVLKVVTGVPEQPAAADEPVQVRAVTPTTKPAPPPPPQPVPVPEPRIDTTTALELLARQGNRDAIERLAAMQSTSSIHGFPRTTHTGPVRVDTGLGHSPFDVLSRR